MTQQITLRYSGQGLDILGLVLIGSILNFITLGLYFPWMINSVIKYVCRHAHVANHAGNEPVRVEFTGSGTDLFGRFILWMILTMVTFGLYTPWAVNGIYGYVVEHIEVHVMTDQQAESLGSEGAATSVQRANVSDDKAFVIGSERDVVTRLSQSRPLRAAGIAFVGAVFFPFVWDYVYRAIDFLPQQNFVTDLLWDIYYPLSEYSDWVPYLLGLLTAGLGIFALQQLRKNN